MTRPTRDQIAAIIRDRVSGPLFSTFQLKAVHQQDILDAASAILSLFPEGRSEQDQGEHPDTAAFDQIIDQQKADLSAARLRIKVLEGRELPKTIVMPNGDTLTREYETWNRGVTCKSPDGKFATGEEDWELVEQYGLEALVRALLSAQGETKLADQPIGEG